MKEILESIEQYTRSLEQRLTALESAVSILQAQLTLSQTQSKEQAHCIEALEARVAALEEERIRNIPTAAPIAEEIQSTAKEEQEGILSAPIAVEKETEEEPQSQQQQPQPQAATEPIIEPIIEPITEPIIEPIIDAPTLPEFQKASVYGKPVEDIKQAIALGDRFLFQRELFRQNAEQMQRTFMDLNAMHSFDEAVEYLDTHFDWDKESNTYALFMTALHRRFPL